MFVEGGKAIKRPDAGRFGKGSDFQSGGKCYIWFMRDSANKVFRGLGFLAVIGSGVVLAQESQPEEGIAAAAAILRAVDEQARVCLERLAESENSASPKECADFMASIDGEALGDYREHCAALREWRDNYVESPPPTGQDSGRDRRMLENLVGIERVCGENALRRRTEFIAQAFERLRPLSARPAGALSLRRRVSDLEFNSSLDGWRSELLPIDSNRRVRGETLRGFDQLELELIRRQLDRPRPVQY